MMRREDLVTLAFRSFLFLLALVLYELARRL